MALFTAVCAMQPYFSQYLLNCNLVSVRLKQIFRSTLLQKCGASLRAKGICKGISELSNHPEAKHWEDDVLLEQYKTLFWERFLITAPCLLFWEVADTNFVCVCFLGNSAILLYLHTPGNHWDLDFLQAEPGRQTSKWKKQIPYESNLCEKTCCWQFLPPQRDL